MRRSSAAAWKTRLCLGLLIVVLAGPARAFSPDERLADPMLEARARALSAELRCLVCRNESIDDSEAPLARDLRLLVRRHLVAGDSDNAIRHFMTERYGDYVLLKPPLKPSTYLLWFGTPLLLVGLASAGLLVFRRRSSPIAGPLSPEEQLRLQRLLDGSV